MNCHDALPLMHEYLDGDLEPIDALELKKHLMACPDCREHFRQLEQAEALTRLLPVSPVPEGLTAKVMNRLPPARKRAGWLEWVRRHPAVSVASVFLLVMLGSFLSLWDQDKDMVVKGADLNHVVIQGNTVVVPKGTTVRGDLMVKRGSIQVDGDVEGNLVVIDGSYNLASTAHIAGEVTQVDQMLERVWYRVHELFGSLK